MTPSLASGEGWEVTRAPFVIAGSDGWHLAVPKWFLAWMRLGACARRWAAQDGNRLVVAVSVPTRPFAAAAAAFGHAIADYRRDRRLPTREELSQQVSTLSQGSLVRVVQRDWVRIGRFGGQDTDEVIRLDGSRFRLDRILDVLRLPEELSGLSGRFRVPEPPPSLAELLPGRDLHLFLTDATIASVLVGIKRRLLEELTLPVAPADAHSPPGAIGQLVRPFDPASPVGWRSAVASARADELPLPVAAGPRPLLAILDGAQAVNNWLRDMNTAVVLIVLDRSEPGAENAVLTITQARASATPVPVASLGWDVPPGCEALAFREAWW